MLFRRGASYSQDLRERVFAMADAGTGVNQTARTLMVSASYVSKVLSRRQRTGERSARPQICHVPAKLGEFYPALIEKVMQTPDATLAELCAWLVKTHGITASPALLNRTLIRLGLRFKKNLCGQRNRTAPTSPQPVRHGSKPWAN